MLYYSDVIMGAIASQITRLTIVYSAVYQRKHQSSASLAFVQGIHRWPVSSPHKWPVTRNMFPFDDVILVCALSRCNHQCGDKSGWSLLTLECTIILSIICGLLQFKITIQIIYSVENYYTDYILTPKVANIELILPGLYILCQGVSIYFLSATTNKTPSEMGCYL